VTYDLSYGDVCVGLAAVYGNVCVDWAGVVRASSLPQAGESWGLSSDACECLQVL
jgi:hypothetical protein